MTEHLWCHGSARCEIHDVERASGVVESLAVHNIRQMARTGILEGFIKDDKGTRYPVAKAPDWTIWKEEER